jgi:hypothetical protein
MTDGLDDFFTAARAAGPEPSDALMARVLADADAAQPRVAAAMPVTASRWRRWRAAAVAAVGGGAMATGLASAAVAGVFIGYAGPVTSDWLAGAVSGGEDVQMMAASDLFLGEG